MSQEILYSDNMDADQRSANYQQHVREQLADVNVRVQELRDRHQTLLGRVQKDATRIAVLEDKRWFALKMALSVAASGGVVGGTVYASLKLLS